MASPVKTARLEAEASGYTEVYQRGRGHLVMRNPVTGKFSLDTQAGGVGWHYGTDWANEVDTAWEADTGAWQYKMLQAEYQLHARNVLNAGDVINWLDPASGESVTLQPLALNWVSNDNDSRQQITQPQAVTAAVDGDVLYWQNGYGTGRHFRYKADTAKLIKHLIIDSLANLPAVEAWVTNPYLEIEFILKKSDGVTLYVDGVAWNNSTTTATANTIEFRLGDGTVVWSFAAPGARDSAGSKVTGIFQLRKQGASRYCTVRIPKTWVDGAVFPIEIDPTIDKTVAANADDSIEEGDGTGSNPTNDDYYQMLLPPGSGNWKWAAARFTGITIAADSTIDTSYLTWYGGFASIVDLNVKIHGEDAETPANFATGYIYNRTKTTANATWDATINEGYTNSVSINSIVQELLDTYTYSAGVMAFILEALSTVDAAYLSGFTLGTSYAPKLHIEYTESGGAGRTTKNTDPFPLGINAGISRRVNTH